ncbi:hypothetical protein HaLaN_04996 [Haematococcus lacustris]|uniref:Uncharacterized protein n=1 Tax=Haematococcus lacustris TaxID=44745 RepID=A0A699YHX6_HAELA|nr:hypothetical protein HaLaN_04996 [Haematococcus lacustris]
MANQELPHLKNGLDQLQNGGQLRVTVTPHDVQGLLNAGPSTLMVHKATISSHATSGSGLAPGLACLAPSSSFRLLWVRPSASRDRHAPMQDARAQQSDMGCRNANGWKHKLATSGDSIVNSALQPIAAAWEQSGLLCCWALRALKHCKALIGSSYIYRDEIYCSRAELARVEQQTRTHESTHVRQGGRAVADTLDQRGQGLMSTSFGLANEASSILNDTSAVDEVVHPVSTGSTSVAASPAAVKDGGGFGFEAEVQLGAPPTQGSIIAPAARNDDAKDSSFQGFPSAPLPKAQHLGRQEASNLVVGNRGGTRDPTPTRHTSFDMPTQGPGEAQPFG